MQSFLILILMVIPAAASAQGLKGASLTWFVYSPLTAEISTSVMDIDPSLDNASDLRVTCIADRADPQAGPVSGRCRVVDARGDSWEEDFLCDQPDALPLGLMPGGVASQACQGVITILGGTGRFTGMTGRGLIRQARLATLPDGRIIGLTIRLYDDS